MIACYYLVAHNLCPDMKQISTQFMLPMFMCLQTHFSTIKIANVFLNPFFWLQKKINFNALSEHFCDVLYRLIFLNQYLSKHVNSYYFVASKCFTNQNKNMLWVSTGSSLNHFDSVVLLLVPHLAAVRPRAVQPGPLDLYSGTSTDEAVLVPRD